MSTISNFWGATFKIATSPLAFSVDCLKYEATGDIHIFGIDQAIANGIGVFTFFPALVLTAGLLAGAFVIGVLGTIALILGAICMKIASFLGNMVDSTFSPT